MKITSMFVLCLILLSSSFVVSGPATRLENILATVVSADGYIDKSLHHDFWHEMDSLDSPHEVDKALHAIRNNMLLAQEYQLEVWRSALASYKSQSVVRSEHLSQLRSELETSFIKDIPYPPGSEHYQNMLMGFNERTADADKSTQYLLISSANREAMQMPGRGEFIITEEAINHVLINIQNGFDRLSRLLDREW